MRIDSIELQGYRRLLLAHIHYIKITPESKIQLILGTNGSGKSSLLKELTPLPALPAEFAKEGYKIVKISHNNSSYLLKNTFAATGSKFHFLKDGEELNPGGTATTYKDLVKKEFGITPEIHEMMIGASKFTSMGVAERRNWFTRISDADYTYAIKFYQELKVQLRDMQAGVKLNQSRLVQESEKLLKPEQEVLEREEIVKLNAFLHSLLELKTPQHTNKQELLSKARVTQESLALRSKDLIAHRAKFLNHEGFACAEDIDQKIIDIRSSIMNESYTIEELCKQIEQSQSTLEALEKSNTESFTDVDTHIDQFNAQYAGVKSQIIHHLKFDHPREAYQALMSVSDNVVALLAEMVPNAQRQYNRDSYAQAVELTKALAIKVTTLDAMSLELHAKKKELEHYRLHNETKCPKCDHVWYQGYDERTYKDVLHQLDQCNTASIVTKTSLEKQTQSTEEIKQYLEIYRGYMAITRGWVILNPLWEHIVSTGLVFDNPTSIAGVLHSVKMDLNLMIQMEEINLKLKDTVALKELLSHNQSVSHTSLLAQLADLNARLYTVTASQRSNKAYLVKLNTYKVSSLAMDKLTELLEKLDGEMGEVTKELHTMAKREALNESIQVVQLELTRREQILSRVDIQKALVSNIEAQIVELTDRHEVLKIAVKELSPSEGLIAKGLTGFINHFILQVNSFIKKIWLYPLQLVPIIPDASDDVDLDYRFQVVVNDEVPISDVSKTSSGMKEVIDLGFRIVSMQYLGLSEAPLYLDELAASFDVAHRQSAFYVITNLLTSANFSQIFMISHYESSYGSLKNTDITVLCPSNVSLPKDMAFNTKAIIR